MLALLESYQEHHLVTSVVIELEAEIEQRVYEQLGHRWQNGWDFCTATNCFGDRGVSVLIQNRQIDWKQIWEWLVAEYPTLPEGAMINFEVWDNIHEGVMTSGTMQLRRLLLSSGVYEQRVDAGGEGPASA